ncbi:phosphate ABC transporter permease subunit PstC [Coraliomargarita akajimensis]|uniref:Phosphate transport system permease protein n=1 Tax=Coraliomargarita akajimensis (strain DSM 45221 / IAM 15411 / JCM 23193 / KCTC 12865 / 04OKA010-24) TaxID=583355 RepID=D5EMB1_CORAD|nr:phosphate ABC transporter permease subunit PstC [Coraliomargarita akajimensis]ADE55271.1 phosphate ABC transporter, inner membrane subunit PstC [Coraliomargarita akajimensis DSM 45221]
MAEPTQRTATQPAFSRRRSVLFGKDSDSIIKSFFGSSATVAIVVLTLITIFLFKEGAGFLGLYHKSLQEYRLSGLEYVDILKEKREDYTALTRYLNDVRAQWINELKDQGYSQAEISKTVMAPEAKALFMGYMRTGSKLRGFIKEKMDTAIEIRDQHITNENLRATLSNYAAKIDAVSSFNYKLNSQDRAQFVLKLNEFNQQNSIDTERVTANQQLIDELKTGRAINSDERSLYLELLEDEYKSIERSIVPVNFQESVKEVTSEQERYADILAKLETDINAVLVKADAVNFKDPDIEKRIVRFKELNAMFLEGIDSHLEKLKTWDQQQQVGFMTSLGAFLTGKEWVTASDQQDWYGLLPLLTGSLLISAIALFFAIPFGVGAAIYVNQIAGPVERNLIKPYIEFVSAIPSVVIGFFGVVVFGEFIRQFSQWEMMSWVPFFPLQERLNAFTAGCLLALMAIPTIFTLAEDAINNIPRHFKEASLAIGATPLQTTMRVIVPTALSGIISAIMLGFGRVIGETMVVLLCAGNRIKIPDYTDGMGVFFEPVHTMTGIIAQEMGEVVRGSVHYRALFMVGIVLFFASLFINWSAQWVVKRYRKVGD